MSRPNKTSYVFYYSLYTNLIYLGVSQIHNGKIIFIILVWQTYLNLLRKKKMLSTGWRQNFLWMDFYGWRQNFLWIIWENLRQVKNEQETWKESKDRKTEIILLWRNLPLLRVKTVLHDEQESGPPRDRLFNWIGRSVGPQTGFLGRSRSTFWLKYVQDKWCHGEGR